MIKGCAGAHECPEHDNAAPGLPVALRKMGEGQE
jgi:hypothetical protein